MTDVDVAVVGGGLAGLAAADRLRRGGREVVVLEATDRVGGRQRTGRLAGEVLEEGAVFFGPQYRALGAYVAASGLGGGLKRYAIRSMKPLPVPPARSTLGQLTRSAGLPAGEKLRLFALAVSLRPRFAEISRMLGSDVRSPALTRLDRVDAESYLSGRVGPRFVDNVVSPVLQSLGFAPASEWSALGALLLLAFARTRSLHAVAEGNDRIARSMAEDLDVRTGCGVVAVSPGPSGVDVALEASGASGRLRCRDVVLAVPALAASGLVGGGLSESLRRFRYSSSVVPAVAVRHLDADLPAVSFFGDSGRERRLSGVVAERSSPGSPVVAYAALGDPWSRELFDAPDDEVVALLVDLLDEVHGGPVEVLESRVVRWRAAVPLADPGTLERRREVESEVARVPHLAVAGDFMVSPSQEGAVVSGERAAERVLAG